MFSGLTNQFTSLVGAVKGGQTDEDASAPTQDASAADATVTAGGATLEQDANAAAGGEHAEGEEGAKSEPSLVNSILTEATGWLGSAKGWLGSASIPSMPAMPTMAMPSMPAMPAMPSIPSIPGLRKSGGDAAEAGADGEQADATAGAISGEDDDKSRYISATEGADSHPASGGGTPTGEEGQIGQGKGEDVKITTKVTQQAKHFGSFLSSAINKAGAKIKETVKDNTILESFNKEQEAFIKGQAGNESGAAPWLGLANEGKIKEEILGLAQDRRNFVRAPPAGVDFEFNYDTSYPTAIAIMAEDKALEQMRFELVPKIITEENFWRNYFYRVSLIIQAAELGTLGADGVGQASSGEDVKTKQTTLETDATITRDTEKSTANPVKDTSDKTVDTTAATTKLNAQTKKSNSKQKSTQDERKKLSESEFVSDSFQTTTETDLEEIKDGMRKLGIDTMTQQILNNDEEQWEKDLEAELKDYEVVSESGGDGGGGIGTLTSINIGADTDDELPTISNLRTRSTNNDWEEMADLIEDTDDLKTLKSLKRVMLGYQ
ncbi:synapse-associated protein of 47 kDa isoform X1 [Teleopsis dalmanni]|uniref:synapse-associated protein of 47 kDa isoform X1 n=1 Tax=Teleopsis dalmanni TaxID=139649 RepID=UPI0018CCD4AE|nr:synapse-associated protein of 47 kDa isoform X1 [Teleopsis dalmanni]XP_037953701.1 synapse-associated protein of 47 kDa isoform X1 [Teleopsis dalmanni]XP_037953702.1 synapse-associated protein of 47 kDa isoform X1 [Teleopsis dalmanni]XP_037953703.1 synapse-associated protein of 47 kDa isoform X1 [Teleopsis dalmanni]XP_037953705.1 synapse-associated protein of 47 kDa isoform X1 [Teleopsis dalmanni]XP_037953706.1 synapse-associated protein of 47 kDa isoform X1 [Teleopsis dalmanni]